MSDRKKLIALAEETDRICQQGYYILPDGRPRSIEDDLATACDLAKLFEPESARIEGPESDRPTRIEVTVESTMEAAERLVRAEDGIEREPDDWSDYSPCLLNFASAKRPGGGWLSGAVAQEECLARASGLVPTLVAPQTVDYYDLNWEKGPLYTDALIHSPGVPFFRDDAGNLLEEPYLAGVITCPAPNLAGVKPALREDLQPQIQAVLDRRARRIVAVAWEMGYDNLVLGAWGCGVFQNDPEMVASAFKKALADFPFEYVVFAILGPHSELHDTFARVLDRE